MDVSLTYANQLKGLLAKADGKDKFIALLQYAAMFASAGEPGAFLAAQKSLSAARKPFRVFKPVEFLMPLVERPPKGKGLGACLAYVSVPPEAAAPPRIFAEKQQRVPSFPDNGPPRGVVPCARARETKRMSASAASAVSPLIHARLVL
jgi:hypothetical protein